LSASEEVSVGDLVSLSGSGYVAKSSMSHPILSKVIGVAKSNAMANETVKIAIQGQLVSGIKVSANSPALSYGDTVFLEELGSVSKTPPQINGTNHVVEVGVLVDEVGPVFLFLSRRIAI
jgi:hypothetical protein